MVRWRLCIIKRDIVSGLNLIKTNSHMIKIDERLCNITCFDREPTVP